MKRVTNNDDLLPRFYSCPFERIKRRWSSDGILNDKNAAIIVAVRISVASFSLLSFLIFFFILNRKSSQEGKTSLFIRDI